MVLHYISYGMRIAVVKDAISQVYDDGAEKIQKHFHYSLNPKYIHSHKNIDIKPMGPRVTIMLYDIFCSNMHQLIR